MKSKKNKKPEIQAPPNCPYFVKCGTSWLFRIKGNKRLHHETVSVAVYDPPKIWRPVIAAVAVAYWQIEQDRVWPQAWVPDKQDFATKKQIKAHDVVGRTIAQIAGWRAWGGLSK